MTRGSINWVQTLGWVRQPRRGNRSEQRDDFGLSVTAGFFQNAAQLLEDRIARDAAIRGYVCHGFAGGKTAGDAGLGRREIEQRLHELDRRRLRQSYGSQH